MEGTARLSPGACYRVHGFALPETLCVRVFVRDTDDSDGVGG